MRSNDKVTELLVNWIGIARGERDGVVKEAGKGWAKTQQAIEKLE